MLTTLHVVFGTLGVVSGFAGLLSKKGSPFHRQSGKVFLVTMIVMGVTGSLLAIEVDMPLAAIAGVLTAYLVISSWLTVSRKVTAGIKVKWLMLLASSAILLFNLGCGTAALNNASGTAFGFGPAAYFFFAFFALFAVYGDGKLLYKGKLHGGERLTRHLWRMCFALYLGTGSLFTGPGAQAFPESWQNHWGMSLPENLVVLVMLFYIATIRFRKGQAVAVKAG